MIFDVIGTPSARECGIFESVKEYLRKLAPKVLLFLPLGLYPYLSSLVATGLRRLSRVRLPTLLALAKSQPPRKFETMWPGTHKECPEALQLLARMLVFDRKERISLEEALAHPFLKPIRLQARS